MSGSNFETLLDSQSPGHRRANVGACPALLRVQEPNGVYHVTARGVGGLAVFPDDELRRVYLRLLRRTLARYDWICHAYCLLSTHFHLIVQIADPNLSAGMQSLNGIFGAWFNDTCERRGHVFEGRFRSWPIETDEYFAKACNYVWWNPVEAGLCDRPEEWRWTGGSAQTCPGSDPGPCQEGQVRPR